MRVEWRGHNAFPLRDDFYQLTPTSSRVKELCSENSGSGQHPPPAPRPASPRLLSDAASETLPLLAYRC
ncbi:hypothetical protein EVAR_51181_1 [Eumeta japonica]|uniref:Uncharacterized protein n=1 Tax=Eumeta variegata TaxID=151549 RepID=A0A4C1XFH0_EUMVA|nr:hypothetical protein EVAR_51181_1 [Eumeta japonica]